MARASKVKARIPTHPGALLREFVMEALDETVTSAAKKMGVSRGYLHKILREEAPISAEMAVRLGKFCGNGPDIWWNMQTARDLAVAKKALSKKIGKIPTVPARTRRPVMLP